MNAFVGLGKFRCSYGADTWPGLVSGTDPGSSGVPWLSSALFGAPMISTSDGQIPRVLEQEN